MDINIEKIKNNFSEKKLQKMLFIFFAKKVKLFVFLVALSLFSYCVYIWYGTIYAPGWSESKKQEYINNKEKEVVFDKDTFEKNVTEFRERSAESKKKLEDIPDIFRLDN